MELTRQLIVTVPRHGSADIFEGTFREFIAARGLPHAGPLIDAGDVYCSVTLGPAPLADAHWRGARPAQIQALTDMLLGLGLSRHLPCGVMADGERLPCTVGMLPGIPARLAEKMRRDRRPPSRQMLAAELLRAGTVNSDLSGMTLPRVVWGRPEMIRLHDPAVVGLADRCGRTPGIRAIHVGDPDFWYEKLRDDYGRDEEAFEIGIMPAPGDVLVDDVQYALPEEDGTKADSAILLTTRRVLRPGRDFRVVRELIPETAAPVPA